MFGNSQLMGVDMGFPDVCLTPAPPAPAPIPIPYPNITAGPTGVSMCPNVMFMCTPVHTMTTNIPQTNGDNAGVAMGVASGTVMMTGRHLTAAFTVLGGCMPITKLTSVSLQNSTNCPGARAVPSQVKVILLK